MVTSRSVALVAALLGVSAAWAQLPVYTNFVLQARGSGMAVDNHNLPESCTPGNASPAINDAGQVTFRYVNFLSDDFDEGIWAGMGGVGESIVPSQFFSATNPTINASGEIAWANNFVGTTGVYRSAFTGGEQLALGGYPINERAEIAFDGSIGVRVASAAPGTSEYVVIAPDGSTTQYAAETNGVAELFTPNYNNIAQMAGKVMLDDGTQQLRRMEAGGSYAVLADNNGALEGFLDGTDLNDDSVMAFIANLSGGELGVGLAGNDGVEIIADSISDFEEILAFAPRMNNHGWVAFRAVDAALGEGIYVANRDEMVRVIGIGDSVMTDLGEGIVTSLSGSVDINTFGDVVFNVGLEDVFGADIGEAVYIGFAPEPASFVLLAVGLALPLRRR